jgi:hypothetical protein
MRTKSFFAAAACAVAVAGAGAGAALAGEVTGPFPDGHTLWTGTTEDGGHTLHGNSICAFSGLNIPDEFGPGTEGTDRVQSYGQIVAAGGKADVPSPGVACNGNTGFLAGP